MKRTSLGFILVISVPYMAAISSISGIRFGGLEYKGFLWLFTLVFGLLLIAYHLALNRETTIPFPIRIWLPWVTYIWLSLLWGGIEVRYNIQNPCQIMTPFVVGILASLYIRDEYQLSKLMKAFTFCLVFVAIVFVIFWYGPGASIQKHGMGFGPRVTGLTLVLIGGLFMSGLRENAFRSVLGWSACLTIVTLSGSRMATIALLLHWCFYPIYRRAQSRVFGIAIIVVLAVALFYSPIFQKRFFEEGSGSIKQIMEGEFSGSGRFQFWPVLWQIAQDHVVLGGGAGYSATIKGEYNIPGDYDMPSNDYLRILLDYGSIGLFLFISSIILQLYKVRRIIRTTSFKDTEAFVTAYLGLIALFIITMTENTTTYVLYFMNPLFAILGAAYGVKTSRRRV